MRRLLILAAVATGTPAAAQTPPGQETAVSPASNPMTQRARDVVAVLRGQADLPNVFTPGFLAQVPPQQIAAVARQLSEQFGAVRELEGARAVSGNAGTIRIAFERAIVEMSIQLEADAPHRIAGLNVTGNEPIGGDSADVILGELRQLPGQVSFQIARLGDGAPIAVAALEPDRALAIGSSFKLIILAELSRQVQAGRRRWSDVVPVDRHSLPSGILQDWPLGSPVTLHTLASLMISRSDNTATDVLLRLTGRENVERMMIRMGLSQAARNRPLLSTIELFQLKADDAEVRTQWATADEAGRRRILRERYEEGGAAIEISRLFAAGPTAIETVEWFASATDMARVMNWLRLNGDDTAKAVMAISPGLAGETATAFSYVGFKGGSEPGVINLTYLIRNNQGAWHVVTGSWNNPAAVVDEARFAGLMSRAARLVR
jgi:beta-lactamase class A